MGFFYTKINLLPTFNVKKKKRHNNLVAQVTPSTM